MPKRIAPKKATRPDGTIVSRGPEKHLIRIYVGRRAGKRTYESKTVDGSLKEARAALTQFAAERKRTPWAAVTPSKLSVREWVDRWLTSSGKATDRTRGMYRSYLERYALAALGDLRLRDVGPEDIERVIRSMPETTGPRTRHHVYAILRTCFRQALKKRLIDADPVALVDAPSVVTQAEDFAGILTETEQQDMIRQAYEAGDRLASLIELVVMAGLRPAEARVLTKKSLRMVYPPGSETAVYLVEINKAATRDASGKEVLGPTKTRATRYVPIPEPLWHRLAAQVPGEGYLYPNKLRPSEWLPDKSFWKACKRAGLRINRPDYTPYAGRHNYATRMLEAGAAPRATSELMGHADPNTTAKTYTHVLPAHMAQAAALMDRLTYRP